MLSKENLEKFTKSHQTDIQNVIREYCQHLFLSYLYQNPMADRLLFKGGTALHLIFKSPRFSEDLDFTGSDISHRGVESIFTDTLSNIESTGIQVEIVEGKKTSGGYLGIALFDAYELKIKVQIEVSLRNLQSIKGVRAIITNDYIPTYTLVHLPIDQIIQGKLEALFVRQKPRDFYDYFFLLSESYPLARQRATLEKVLKLLRRQRINFRTELSKFLPSSHALMLKDFSNTLEQKILQYG